MKILGVGRLTVDLLMRCDSEWNVLDYNVSVLGGGSVCNTLSYLGIMGWPCAVIGAVGHDELGDAVCADLESFGIDTSSVLVDTATSTRRCTHQVVTSGPRKGAHRFLDTCIECGRDTSRSTEDGLFDIREAITAARDTGAILLISNISPHAIAIAEVNRESGGINVLDPARLPANHHQISTALRLAHLLKYSHTLDWHGFDLNRFFRQSRDVPAVVVRTDGRAGAKLINHYGTQLRLSPARIRPADTAGAGDAFTAGLILSLGQAALADLRNVPESSLEDSLLSGQALAMWACLSPGAKGTLYAYRPMRAASIMREIINTGRLSPISRRPHVVDGLHIAWHQQPPDACRVCFTPRAPRDGQNLDWRDP